MLSTGRWKVLAGAVVALHLSFYVIKPLLLPDTKPDDAEKQTKAPSYYT